MPPNPARSPSRLLAPLALILLVVAVYLVVVGSSGNGEEPKTDANTSTDGTFTTGGSAGEQPRDRSSYTVKAGDTLGGIAQRTGVKVETLQELNPDLDPQALGPGQKIKLRE